MAPSRTNLWCTVRDSNTCTPRWGLCSRGSSRSYPPLVAITGLVTKEVLVEEWQLGEVSWKTPRMEVKELPVVSEPSEAVEEGVC